MREIERSSDRVFTPYTLYTAYTLDSLFININGAT